MQHPHEFTDTDPRAMEVWLDLLRRMTPGERLDLTLALNDLAFRKREASVRSLHPTADDNEVRVRIAASHLPRDLVIRVYGWDPEAAGVAGGADC